VKQTRRTPILRRDPNGKRQHLLGTESGGHGELHRRPAATTVLSDFGADVVKVEPPGIGDPYRYFYRTPPNPQLPENYTWQLTNRNKRFIVVDLKSPRAAEVLTPLVRWADVFVTNFPPHVRKGLKIPYEDLSPLNPRMIYADITGYGENGPEADKPGFDITAYWARSGLMEFTRNANSPPTIPVPGIGDHATATSLYAGIVTGLYRRERTGKGCNVTASLIAAHGQRPHGFRRPCTARSSPPRSKGTGESACRRNVPDFRRSVDPSCVRGNGKELAGLR